MSTSNAHPRPIALLAIAASTVGLGGVIGATMNAINGAVSPAYFRNVMRWADFEHIWRASLAQGILEGLLFGVVFAFVFTLVVGIVSRAQCPYDFALRQLVPIIAGVYGCWVVGGLIGVGLAALSPELFERNFPGVPDQHSDLLRYAWVGGSIWGAMAGGVMALVIGSVLFPVRWRRAQQRSAT